jgi:hypothetical protein
MVKRATSGNTMTVYDARGRNVGRVTTKKAGRDLAEAASCRSPAETGGRPPTSDLRWASGLVALRLVEQVQLFQERRN